MKRTDKTAAVPVAKLTRRGAARERNRGDPSTDRDVLQHWVRAPTTPQRVAQRSRIVLLSLDGVQNKEIASRLAVSKATVKLWTQRFAENGAEALLHDAPGRGRPRSMARAAMCDRLRQANLLGPDNLPLSIRAAAAFLGISASSVWRTLKKP